MSSRAAWRLRSHYAGRQAPRGRKECSAGSIAGLVLGLLAAQVLSAVVYQASPRDPLVLAGAVLAMALVGLLAMWIPAQRALAVDPLQLMREQ